MADSPASSESDQADDKPQRATTLGFNHGKILTYTNLFTFLEILVSIIMIQLTTYHNDPDVNIRSGWGGRGGHTVLLLSASTFLTVSFLLLLARVYTIRDEKYVIRSFFDVIYNFCGMMFFISGGLATVSNIDYVYGCTEPIYKSVMSAAVLSIVNGVFYTITLTVSLYRLTE